MKNRDNLIRHIATSYNGDTFAVAEFERIVYIWSFKDLKKLTTLYTKLDFGGQRLAISSTGTLCAVGAYDRYGISMYDLNTDDLLWSNKDLKKVQVLRFNHSGDRLYACFSDKSMHVINALTGEIIEKIRGIKNIWFSPYENIYLTEGNNISLCKSASVKKLKIERQSFAILDVAFAKDMIFVTEAGGPLRAIDINSGKVLWNINIDDNHFLKLGYLEEKDILYAVLWPYVNGGNKVLYKIDKQTGNVLYKTEMEKDTIETEFIKKTSFLLNSNGSLYELNGEIPKIVNKIRWE